SHAVEQDLAGALAHGDDRRLAEPDALVADEHERIGRSQVDPEIDREAAQQPLERFEHGAPRARTRGRDVLTSRHAVDQTARTQLTGPCSGSNGFFEACSRLSQPGPVPQRRLARNSPGRTSPETTAARTTTSLELRGSPGRGPSRGARRGGAPDGAE